MLHPFFRRSNVTRGYANEACYRRVVVVWVVAAEAQAFARHMNIRATYPWS